MKYFSGPRTNQIVNIWMINHLAIFHFQLRKKWCLQKFYAIEKMDDAGDRR